MIYYYDFATTDPAENLALEEYLFEHLKNQTIFLTWQNERCLVLGKNQNVYQEIKVAVAEKRGIPIFRRNSGGGTVFHDLGNLNYSFITDKNSENIMNFEYFINPIMAYLKHLGLDVRMDNKSDIFLKDKKISGNSQAIKNNRILHHGTLLFETNLSDLQTLLSGVRSEIESKAVDSRRSPVTNIATTLKTMGKSMDLSSFRRGLEEYIINHTEIGNGSSGQAQKQKSEPLQIPQAAFSYLQETKEDKYNDWEWNFARSPEFKIQKTITFQKQTVEIFLQIKKGRIQACGLKDLENRFEEIAKAFIGVKFIVQELLQIVQQRWDVQKCTLFQSNEEIQEFIEALF